METALREARPELSVECVPKAGKFGSDRWSLWDDR
jgi:hypothetical protein